MGDGDVGQGGRGRTYNGLEVSVAARYFKRFRQLINLLTINYKQIFINQ
jgi:hypothetical protein